MRSKRNLSVELAEKHELQRQQTINKVFRAVDDIKSECKKVTISALAEYTGRSRSTFAKPHIREVLVEYGYAVGAVIDLMNKATVFSEQEFNFAYENFPVFGDSKQCKKALNEKPVMGNNIYLQKESICSQLITRQRIRYFNRKNKFTSLKEQLELPLFSRMIFAPK